MVIRYKVILEEEGQRFSCHARGNYRLEYKQGTIVEAPAGTLGILVFKTLDAAGDFSFGNGSFKIIEVRPIGKGKIVRDVCASQDPAVLDSWYHWWYHGCCSRHLKAPPGTIAYQAVEVLE